MPRKHEAIIQSGGNIGKLKKGYKYSVPYYFNFYSESSSIEFNS